MEVTFFEGQFKSTVDFPSIFYLSVLLEKYKEISFGMKKFFAIYLKLILITVFPLHWSVIHRDFEMTKYLLGNNVNKVSSDGLTCLMHAVRVMSQITLNMFYTFTCFDWQHSLTEEIRPSKNLI